MPKRKRISASGLDAKEPILTLDVLSAIFMFVDLETLFLRCSKLDKSVRNLIQDLAFVRKICNRHNIVDFTLIAQFEEKLKSPEIIYKIIIKPSIYILSSFNKFKQENADSILLCDQTYRMYASQRKKVEKKVKEEQESGDEEQEGSDNEKQEESEDEDQGRRVFLPDMDALKDTINLVHSKFNKQFPIFLQQLSCLFSQLGSDSAILTNVLLPHGFQEYPPYLEKRSLFPFAKFDLAGHGDGGEQVASVLLTNDLHEYETINVSETLDWEEDSNMDYEKGNIKATEFVALAFDNLDEFPSEIAVSDSSDPPLEEQDED